MSKATELLEMISTAKVSAEGVKHNLHSQINDLYARIRTFMTGVGWGFNPMTVSDIEFAEIWPSEYPAIYVRLERNKEKWFDYLLDLAIAIRDADTIDDINKANNKYGIPGIDHTLINMPKPGEFPSDRDIKDKELVF